jgi:predicted N-acetyltransferase YhbS
MTIRSLKDGEQDACLDLWDLAFDDTPRAYFEKYFKEPTWQLNDTVVCEEDGKLVSAVHVVRRIVETRKGRRNMAGIANVGTDPAYRGGGRSTACLEETHRRLEADPWFDFGLLGTGIHDYYARLGWQRWEFQGWQGVCKHTNRDVLSSGSLRPATIEDFPRIQRLYENQNQNQPIAVVRDEAYWLDWLGLRKTKKSLEDFRCTEEGDAYARTRTGGGETGKVVQEILEIGGNLPLHEMLVVTGHVFLLYPLTREQAAEVLEDPQPYPIPWWMVRPVQGKPLPDLAGGYFYEADGF